MQSRTQHMKSELCKLGKRSKPREISTNLQRSVWLSAPKLKEKKQTTAGRFPILPGLRKKTIHSLPSQGLGLSKERNSGITECSVALL